MSQAAALLGVTAHTLREWTSQGVIHASRTAGGHRRYDRDDVLRMIGAAGSGSSVRDIHERVLELATVADTAQTVFDQLEPREVLRAVCDRLMEALHCTTAVVSLYDPELDAVVTNADYNVDGQETPPSEPYRLADYPVTAKVIHEQRPALINVGDAAADPNEVAVLNAYGNKSLLILPLIHRGESIGIVELIDRPRERRYNEAELELARRLCAQAAIAVMNAHAFDELRRHAEELTIMDQTLEAITRRLDLGELLDDLGGRMLQGIAADRVYVYDLEQSSGDLVCVARAAGPHDVGDLMPMGTRFRHDRARACMRAVAQKSVTHAVITDQSVSARDRRDMKARGELSVMNVPMVYDDQVIGVIAIIATRSTRRFTRDDERLAVNIGIKVGLAIHNARLFDETNRRNREAQLLLETATAIGRSVGLDETLDTITRLLMDKLSMAWSNIYDYDPVTGDIRVIAYNQLPEVGPAGDWVGRTFHYTDYPDWRACIEERRAVASYADEPDLFTPTDEDIVRWGDQATLTVPLVYQDELFGLLDVAENRVLRRFSDDDKRVVMAIAGQAAVAIHNARLFEHTSRRNLELSTLLRAAETMTSTVDLKGVLSTLSGQLREALAISAAEIYDFDATRQRLSRVGLDADAGEGDGAEPLVYDLSDSPTLARCVNEKRPLVSFIDDSDLPEPTRADMEERGYQSRLVVPMVYNDEVVGLIYLAERGEMRIFRDEEVRLAAAIAAQGATAMENARAYVREQQERSRLADLNRRLTALVELSGKIRGLVAEDELLRLLGLVMSDALGFRSWAAYVHEPGEAAFRCPAAVGLPIGSRRPGGEVGEGDGDVDGAGGAEGGGPRAAAAAANGAAAGESAGIHVPESVLGSLLIDATPVSHSLFVDHRCHTWTDEERSWLSTCGHEGLRDGEWQAGDALFVPMIGDQGQLIGYIEACDPADGRLPDELVVNLLEVFVAKAASNIELHRVYEQLAEQAITDGLTGLYNHRHLDERLENEVAKATRYGTPLSVLMIDIDDFKPFNDTYGHPSGDSLLRQLADIMRENTRQKIDLVSRYGGEEFVVVLPNTGLGGAEVVADRLRGEVDGGPSPARAAGKKTNGRRSAEIVAERIRLATAERHFEGVPTRRYALQKVRAPRRGTRSAEHEEW